MIKISREIKTALIAILIIVSSIWGFNFLKGKNIFQHSYEYYARYNRLEGLVESGTVYIKGYKVGNITNINYDYNGSGDFIVKIVLTKDYEIPYGSYVIIKTSNLIASAKDLEIVLGDSSLLHHIGDTLPSLKGEGLSELIDPITSKINMTLQTIDQTLKTLGTILTPEFNQHLQNSIASVDSSLEGIQNQLSQGGDLYTSLDNLEDITSNLKQNNQNISNILSNLSELSDSLNQSNIKETIDHLNKTLLSIAEITDKINNSEGSMGLLVNDSSLYNELAQAVISLDSLLVDLKENPDRYVQVSVFGGKSK